MSIHRFTPGQRFSWRGSLYEIRRVLMPEQRANVENLETGALLLVDLAELTQALFADLLRFVDDSLSSGNHLSPSQDLSSYPAEAVQIVRWRLEVIRPLLDLPARELTEAAVIDQVNLIQAAHPNPSRKLTQIVSRTTVYRWINRYRRSGGDLRSLLPRLEERGGSGKSRLDPAVNALVKSVLQEFYLRAEPLGMDDLVALVAARIDDENRLRPQNDPLPIPSRATIARRIAELDLQDKFTSQHGRKIARRKFKQVEQMTYPQMPYERVETDHTRCDVVVIDERDNLPLGRPTLTYCLDLATRYPLGYYLGFEPPSYYTVMECLYQTICPKENVREKYGTEHDWLAHGIPGTLVIDNGKEFIGQDLNDACDILGIVLQQCPIMTPELKAGVERHFRTLNSGVFHTLPGTTFSNVFERGEYDSLHQACISLDELEKAMALFLVDIYSERYQRGLKGIPARQWEKAIATHFVPRLPPSRDELAILLGRVDWRVLHPYGIEFECLHYNAADLGELRVRLKGEKVKLKYHPGDLSRIYLFDPFEKRYHEVPALDQEYTRGLSFWKHRLIRRVAAQEADQVDLAALGRARLKIQEMVDRARSRKKTSTRSKVARWDGKSPQPSGSISGTLPPNSQSPQPSKLTLPSTSSETEVYDYDYNLPPSRRDE
jgi:putative transposase